MLQHQQEIPEQSQLNLPGQPEVVLGTRVQEYLNQLWEPAATAQDAANQLQARKEMRTHIESLIEANIELGDSQEQAVDHALEQFGSSRTVQTEWRRTCPGPGSMKRSMLTGLRFSAIGSLAAGMAVPLSFHIGKAIDWHGLRILGPLSLLIAPFVAGVFTGIFDRRRSLRTALCAPLLLLLPVSIVDTILSRTIGGPMIRVNPSEWAQALLFGVPIACAGAGIVSLVRWLKHGPRRIVIAW